MISTSAAYQTAAAKLNKVPIFLLEIEGYARGFSNADLGAFTPLPFANQPGALASPPTSSAWVEDPTNPTYHYGTGEITGLQTGIIERWSSNSLLSHTLPGILYFYSPSGFYAAPGGDNPAAPSRSFLAAVTATMTFATTVAADGFIPIWNAEVSVDGGSTWHTIGSSGTPGSYTVSLDITSLLGSISSFDFTQIQFRFYSASSLTSIGSSPGSSGTVSSVGLSFAYNYSTLSATAYPWLVEQGIDDHLVTVNDLDGGVNIDDLVVHVQDFGLDSVRGIAGLITQDFPGFTFEGKGVHLRQGWGKIDKSISDFPVPIIDVADFATLFTGNVDSVESENSNTQYCFTCPSVGAALLKTIYTVADNGANTDQNNPRTLNGHPLDILLSALENECGLSTSQIDVATITSYRDTIYSGAQMQFTITSPPVAKDFIESEICKPMGAYLRPNNLGQMTVVFAYPISTTPVFAFDEDVVLGIPDAGQADLINQVSTRFDADTKGNFQQESVEDNIPSIEKYGLFGAQVIESKGLRSGLNGFFFAAITAFLIFLRYANKALCHGDNGKNSSSNPVTVIWSTAALVEPGDFVTVTHSKVPDRKTGTLGIVDKAYIVMDRTWQFFLGNVQYKMVEVDLSKFKQFLITSNGEAAYTAASSGDKAALMFLCGDNDKYSNGDPANTLC